MKAGTVVVKMAADTSEFHAAMDAVEQRLDAFEARLQGFGGVQQGAGAKVVSITNHFGPPPQPHEWARSATFATSGGAS